MNATSRRLASRGLLALLWLLHLLPLAVLARLGVALGGLLWRLGRSRRRIALRNLELCFPEHSPAQREALAREHFGWLGRSLLERGLLMYASADRLRRMVRIEGDLRAFERDEQPLMWLVPHFVGMEFLGPALMLNQSRPGIDIYQKQTNPVFDAALLASRGRFGDSTLVDRDAGIRPVMRAIQKKHAGFVNAPDQDFGERDAAFVPFFGVPAATLMAPARLVAMLKMRVQPIVMVMLPGGQGYLARVMDAPEGMDDPDPVAATAAMNRWVEARIREHPAQYLWVHRRFKTRPAGEASLY